MEPAYFDMTEATNRMKRRNKTEVCWTLKIYGEDLIVRWRYIDGQNARNWDGKPAPNPGCTALERMVWKQDFPPRYSNYW